MRFGTVSTSYATMLAVTAFSARVSAQPPAMQSGGLAPPPPGSGPPPPPPGQRTPTQQTLEEAEQRDSGRGLEFVYFEAGGGAQFVALDALGGSGVLLPDSKTSAVGPVVSVASGVRLLYWTIGPRFRFGHFGDWSLWTLNLDLGWRVPLGQFEPYGFVGGGFAKVDYSTPANASGAATVRSSVSGSGFDVRLGGGADYYVTNVLSVGGTLSVDLLRLSRSADSLVVAAPPGVYTSEASTVGLVVTAGAMLGLHF